jgi:arylsulfatase A-like enzyme
MMYVDREIERLLEGLREAGAADDLLVIVTADHGEAFGEHGAYIHANSLYLEEIHVPLVLWSPGRVPAGFRSDAPVSNVTVPATILDLIGAEAEPAFRQPSLSAFWQDPSAARPWPISEMEHWPWNLETSPSHYGAIRSVLSPEYHYIRNDSLGTELYRWREDPLEAVDLASDESLRLALDELEEALRQPAP